MGDTVRDDMLLVLTPLLFGLSVLSGMMGLGGKVVSYGREQLARKSQ